MRLLKQKEMRMMRWEEAMAFSQAKRNGKKIAGVHHHQCGCGAFGCFFLIPRELTDAKLIKTPKKPTKHPKRREHSMFSGKIID